MSFINLSKLTHQAKHPAYIALIDETHREKTPACHHRIRNVLASNQLKPGNQSHKERCLPILEGIRRSQQADRHTLDLGPYFFFLHTSTIASTLPSCGLTIRSIPLWSGSRLKNVA